MIENCIQQETDTYLLNMSSKENKNKINEYKADVTVEYGEQDLKEILLDKIKKEYIKAFDSKITSSEKESNLESLENKI